MQKSNSKKACSTTATPATSGTKSLKDSIADLSYQDLLNRREEIQERLQVISIPPIKAKKPPAPGAASANHKSRNSRNTKAAKTETVDAPNPNRVPDRGKTSDTHWDFCLKEMMWLATDFQAERKRQISLAKKIAQSVKQFHKTRETRRVRELAEAELKRRRLAARVGREVRGWWTKIERVIAYKQKCSADEERRKAMNRQLVTLVKQTEKYTESLIRDVDHDHDDYSDDDNNMHHKRKRQTIEEALALGAQNTRRSKNRVVDYNRLQLKQGDDQLYGESTASDGTASADDGSYSPSDYDWTDDETTLLEAEAFETQERLRAQHKEATAADSSSFTADPRELRTLEEEQDLPIEQVLERYRVEATEATNQTPEQSTTEEAMEVVDQQQEETAADESPENTKDDDNKAASTTAAASDESEKKEQSTGAMDVDNDGTAASESKEQEDKAESSREILEMGGGAAKSNTDMDEQSTTSAIMMEVDHQFSDADEEVVNDKSPPVAAATKRVTFAPSSAKRPVIVNTTEHQQQRSTTTADASVKYDADDDGDASDVEDFVEGINNTGDEEDDDGSDEFVVDQGELVDDETTIAQEESLPQEMSAKEEIDLLKAENEMSVDELHKLYDGVLGGSTTDNNEKDGDEETKSGVEDSTRKAAINQQPARASSDGDKKSSTVADGDSPVDTASTASSKADQNELDDETTIAQEEALPQEMSTQDEIKLLQGENKLSVEELRKRNAGAVQKAGEVEASSGKEGKAEGLDDKASAPVEAEPEGLEQALIAPGEVGGEEEEFVPVEGGDVYDETTMEAEEKLGRDMTYEEELALLQNENEIPVDQLRVMYASVLDGNESNNGDGSGSDKETSVDGNDDAERRFKRQKVGATTLAEALQEGKDENGDGDGEEEFEPQAGDVVDDETTIEAEERLGRDMSYEDEIALLNKENELSVEELRAKYAGAFSTESAESINGKKSAQTGSSSLQELASTTEFSDGGNADDDAEFVADGEEVDDETTLAAEERLGRDMTPEEELAMLQRESEMPIESLYEMYQKMEQEQAATGAVNGSEDECDDDSSDGSSTCKRKRTSDADSDDSRAKRAKEAEPDEGLVAIQALEKSAERARKTLASRPFLLASWVKLRAYQQTGLNWLVSLQTRRLNGILADEMGLGKTLQTISLLAYLASYKGIWGPHLVIVPTSVIVNWETELKRFCPGMKALCYYGSAKRRKELRSGWTKTNWYHVVVTSYQLAVQDAFAFKRKRWYYLILDEAQNIKNFQSQRWQTLINFNTQRRLLLTGTPLQNNLMELWSLLHFLMPYIFRSRKEFSFWFSNPMNNMIEGTANQNEEMIARLHGIIRPFVLRRLKKDVEKELPGKYEHIVKCPLSRRQMFFYEEYMSRSSTRQSLKKGGNYMGMMNVLMQLRKVCNHPDLFEPRSVVTPFVLQPIAMPAPDCVIGVTTSREVLIDLSEHLMSPLWCGSTASPSMASSAVHDELRSEALLELEDYPTKANLVESDSSSELESDLPPALADLLEEIEERAKSERKSKFEFLQDINSKRCRAPSFPCPSRLLRAVRVPQHPVYEIEKDLLSTPSQLLAVRRSQQERAEDVGDMIKNFVFCVPKAGAPRPALEIRTRQNDNKAMEELLLEPVEEYLRPFRKAHARLTSFFPDKKLVQFDAGKLQTLADLLHDLKRGGHRVLIFTQMSKMLDILEAFLNLNGHTYVRLDGSTGVERRQRLMDRFNNDTKIFSFILSTRSGGMGINLTGADTVIFYDSDWNPAMDAQAQDRAHRIGQTRDVHIYRLITEHSIEENILVKAQQKRNLDILVMDKGKFDGSNAGRQSERAKLDAKKEESSDVFTKGGLRAILGVGEDDDDELEARVTEDNQQEQEKDRGENMTREQMEAAMTNLEDQDDVIALRGAQKEAAEELQEFDESIELKKDSDNEGEDEDADTKTNAKGKAKPPDKPDEVAPEQKSEEEELEKEFAAWQDNVGLDTSALEASLSPTETYGLKFRQEIDPFYSVFAIMEERRRLEASEETKKEINIDQIERDKSMEERRAIDDGDLLGTRPRPEDLVRQRNLYSREKARLKANKKRCTLTGENWEVREDGRSGQPFWYNADTGEALWDKPRVLVNLEADELAREKLWNALPLKPLVQIMSFLVPYPERIQCTKVCRQWRLAATDISFVRHVYPVEQGALARDEKHVAHNHYRTIADALSIALPGDTIEFGDGHYWVNEPGLSIDFPLKFVGDEHNAANVTIEMSGTLTWNAKAGWIEGVTFRRPKISSGEGSKDDMLRIKTGGRVDMIESVIDNTGSSSASAAMFEGSGSSGRWESVIFSGGNQQGIKLGEGAKIELKKCIIRANRGNGIDCADQTELHVESTKIVDNGGFGAIVRAGGAATFRKCHFDRNGMGTLEQEGGGKLSCSQNTTSAEALAKQNTPGFRAVSAG